MKFLYVVGDPSISLSEMTGATRHITECVRSLRQLGHEVKLLVIGDTRSSHQQKQVFQKSRRFMPGFLGAILKDTAKILNDARFGVQIQNAITDFAPDIIYNRLAPFHKSAVVAAKHAGIPVVVEVNASIKETKRYYQVGLDSLGERRERYVLESANAIMVVSAPLKEELIGYGLSPEKIHVNPNGVDPDKFSPAVDASVVREKYGLQDKTVVGFIGCLAVWHGVDTLIEAAALIRPRHPDVYYLVVGTGVEYDNLVKLADERGLSDRVIFTGPVPMDDVPAYINAMDIATALYSDPEQVYGSSTKFYEYMACGRAIVASNVAQMGEFTVDGVNGVLVKPGSVEDLADKLIYLLENPERRAEMGTRARETAIAEHTWLQNAVRIVNVCEGLLEVR